MGARLTRGFPHEIQEVKNAYQAYEQLLDYDPYKVKDFLKAHQFMRTFACKGRKYEKNNLFGADFGAIYGGQCPADSRQKGAP